MAIAMDNLRGIIPDAVMVRVSTYGNDKAAALADVDEFIRAMIGIRSAAGPARFRRLIVSASARI